MKLSKYHKYLLKINLAFIVLVAIVGVLFLVNRYSEPKNFDSVKWKNWETGPQYDLSVRWDMMNSLRENHKLKGMSKTKIIELLGEPTRSFNSTFNYNLGASKRGINYGFLELTFNEKKVVTEFIVGDH